ncbi:MAG: hypothetical protein JNJ94_12600 [Chlorobi bacterium]|nr:hypothetical protein [Chlorobiota bacterium]
MKTYAKLRRIPREQFLDIPLPKQEKSAKIKEIKTVGHVVMKTPVHGAVFTVEEVLSRQGLSDIIEGGIVIGSYNSFAGKGKKVIAQVEDEFVICDYEPNIGRYATVNGFGGAIEETLDYILNPDL